MDNFVNLAKQGYQAYQNSNRDDDQPQHGQGQAGFGGQQQAGGFGQFGGQEEQMGGMEGMGGFGGGQQFGQGVLHQSKDPFHRS
jgi:hypothetical protein